MPGRDTSTNDQSNFLYAACYAGFVGSGVLAVFFLLRDALIGAPLLTPSIFGAAIFGGGVPVAEPAIRIDWVALVSMVHVALFTAVGAPFAYLIHRLPQLRESPIAQTVGLFAVLGIGIVALDALMAPGLVLAIGAVSIAIGNALTAAAMTLFYGRAFAEEPVPVEARR